MTDETHHFRIRVGEFEFEASGDKKFVEKYIKEYKDVISTRLGEADAAAPEAERSSRPRQTTAKETTESPSTPDKPRSRRGKRGGRGRSRTSSRADEEAPETADDSAEETPPERSRVRSAARPSVREDDGDDETRLPSILSDDVRTPLQEFFADKKPPTQQQRVLLLAYFLQKIAERGQFTEGEIREAYQAVDADVPDDLRDTINSGIRTGLFNKDMRGRTTRYALTLKGRQYIENELLPDDAPTEAPSEEAAPDEPVEMDVAEIAAADDGAVPDDDASLDAV